MLISECKLHRLRIWLVDLELPLGARGTGLYNIRIIILLGGARFISLCETPAN